MTEKTYYMLQDHRPHRLITAVPLVPRRGLKHNRPLMEQGIICVRTLIPIQSNIIGLGRFNAEPRIGHAECKGGRTNR